MGQAAGSQQEGVQAEPPPAPSLAPSHPSEGPQVSSPLSRRFQIIDPKTGRAVTASRRLKIVDPKTGREVGAESELGVAPCSSDTGTTELPPECSETTRTPSPLTPK